MFGLGSSDIAAVAVGKDCVLVRQSYLRPLFKEQDWSRRVPFDSVLPSLNTFFSVVQINVLLMQFLRPAYVWLNKCLSNCASVGHIMFQVLGLTVLTQRLLGHIISSKRSQWHSSSISALHCMALAHWRLGCGLSSKCISMAIHIDLDTALAGKGSVITKMCLGDKSLLLGLPLPMRLQI